MHIIRFALVLSALLLTAIGHAQTFSSVYLVQGPQDGQNPASGLTKLDGKFYGTTRNGGYDANLGTVYRIDLNTHEETILHSFAGGTDGANPAEGLTVLNGKLYGLTSGGGTSNGGTIYTIDPATGVETVLASLPNPTAPGFPLVAFNGLLYGTGTACGAAKVGCIFSFDPTTNAETTVYEFEGSDKRDPALPTGLVAHGESLIGTTLEGGKHHRGTIFRFRPETGAMKTLYAFDERPDGRAPYAPLISVGGTLYGTTIEGGAEGHGMVFSFDPEIRQEKDLLNFARYYGDAPLAALLYDKGVLYGTTSIRGHADKGELFSIDIATDATAVIHSFTRHGRGFMSYSPLIMEDGLLYGTLSEDGFYSGGGEVFSVDPSDHHYRLLHYFTPRMQPAASALTLSSGALYGVASAGGAGYGSIFKILPRQQKGSIVYTPAGNRKNRNALDGASALLDVNGIFYGTAAFGGPTYDGSVFRFDPKTRNLRVIYAFEGYSHGDGSGPEGGVIENGGFLYGTTSGGGGGQGTVFKISLAGFAKTTLYSFTGGTDYGYPSTGLTFANGALYGEIASGGTAGYGYIYRVDPESGAKKTVYSFHGTSDGQNPIGGLTYSEGSLFGLTEGNFLNNTQPTAFRFDPIKGTEKVLHTFDINNRLFSGVTMVGNKLYGTISSSFSSNSTPYGAIFKINADTGETSIIYNLPDASNGSILNTSLVHADGALYGTTYQGPIPGTAVVFRFKP